MKTPYTNNGNYNEIMNHIILIAIYSIYLCGAQKKHRTPKKCIEIGKNAESVEHNGLKRGEMKFYISQKMDKSVEYSL